LATLRLEPNPAANQLAFGVTYAYDQSSYEWALMYTTKMDDSVIGELPATIRWAIYNLEAHAFINDWQTTPSSSLKVGSLKIEDKVVLRRLLAHQANLELVFDAEPSSRLVKERFVLPIGDECKNFVPAYFKDLTNPAKRCFEVKEGDLPQ
jgi:hypothetical protein